MSKKKIEKEIVSEMVSVRVIRDFTDENCYRKAGEIYEVSREVSEQLKIAKLIKVEE